MFFSGTVEVDETYIGGQWKNKRLNEQSKGAKRGSGQPKHPYLVFYAGVEKFGRK